MKLGLDLSLGCLSALALAVTTAGACGRTDLFSAHGGSNPSCPPSDPTCVGTDGGGLSAGHDGGGGATGAGGRAGNGGGGGKSGNGGGGGKTCPTGNREICGNKIDDDCNGLIDCADPACFGDPSCSKPGKEICNNGIDDNGDGLIDCADPECVNSISCKTTPGTEISNNGIRDSGNGLVDCADPMCTTFPGCLTVDCSPDTDFGTLAIHGANVTRMIDTVGAPSGYATCAPSGGLGRVGRFEIDATTDVRLAFTQVTGTAHVVELFRAGANETCDRNPLTCVSAGDAAMTTQTFSALPAGVYWLIVESYPGLEGSTTVTLSTGSVTTPEICNNGIDDDGNGLIDCADSACFSSTFCVGYECVPDVNLGTLVVGAAAKEVHTSLSAAPTTSVPRLTSGTHSLPTQKGLEKQAESAQSMRPLPSSSMPLLQISGVVTEPVESVTVVEPSSPGYDSTISQYTPAGRAEKVWVVMAASPAETQVRGLRSQVSLAPARKSSTTCAAPVTCVKARRTSVVASISKRPTRPRPPLGAQVAYPLGAPTVSIMRVTLAPWIARVPKSVSGEQSTVRQPGKVVHIGSAQSTRPLPLSL